MPTQSHQSTADLQKPLINIKSRLLNYVTGVFKTLYKKSNSSAQPDAFVVREASTLVTFEPRISKVLMGAYFGQFGLYVCELRLID